MAQKMPFRRGVRSPASAEEGFVIAQCCVCGLLRAKKRFPAEPDKWIASRAYEQTYGVRPSESRLSHTYCPECHTDFLQRVRPTLAPL